MRLPPTLNEACDGFYSAFTCVSETDFARRIVHISAHDGIMELAHGAHGMNKKLQEKRGIEKWWRTALLEKIDSSSRPKEALNSVQHFLRSGNPSLEGMLTVSQVRNLANNRPRDGQHHSLSMSC